MAVMLPSSAVRSRRRMNPDWPTSPSHGPTGARGHCYIDWAGLGLPACARERCERARAGREAGGPRALTPAPCALQSPGNLQDSHSRDRCCGHAPLFWPQKRTRPPFSRSQPEEHNLSPLIASWPLQLLRGGSTLASRYEHILFQQLRLILLMMGYTGSNLIESTIATQTPASVHPYNALS